MLFPFTGGVPGSVGDSRPWPRGSRTIVAVPGSPRRIESSDISSPSTGLLSWSTWPIIPSVPADTASSRASDANECTPRSNIAGAASTARNRLGIVRYLDDVSIARAMTLASTCSLASAALSLRGSLTSRGAISNRTVSRLCASTRCVSSRMSPRGAGTTFSAVCWRAARARQLVPCTSWTSAALMRIATANTASTACANPIRLERITGGACVEARLES